MQPNHVLTGITNHCVGASSACSREHLVDPFPQIHHEKRYLAPHTPFDYQGSCRKFFTVEPSADPTTTIFILILIFTFNQQCAQEVATRSNITLAYCSKGNFPVKSFCRNYKPWAPVEISEWAREKNPRNFVRTTIRFTSPSDVSQIWDGLSSLYFCLPTGAPLIWIQTIQHRL